MSRGIGPRLRRLEGRFGWQLTTLRHASGAEVTVPSLMLIDAWLRVMLEESAPGLPPRVERFMCGVIAEPDGGELIRGLRAACRDVWVSEEADR